MSEFIPKEVTTHQLSSPLACTYYSNCCPEYVSNDEPFSQVYKNKQHGNLSLYAPAINKLPVNSI